MPKRKRSTEADNETVDEREARLSEKRLRTAARRGKETAEETNERRKSDRVRNINRESNETVEEKEGRLAEQRLRTAARRGNETVEETNERRTSDRLRTLNSRASKWLCLKYEAFNYDPKLDYSNFPAIIIGSMSFKCGFCDALRFEGETPGLCCSGGKISLPELPELPEPLKSLMKGDHPKSKEFLKLIRKYNCSFQMTSFGTSMPMPQSTGFMPTFKIQGQVYHRVGSLLPLGMSRAKNPTELYIVADKNGETQNVVYSQVLK